MQQATQAETEVTKVARLESAYPVRAIVAYEQFDGARRAQQILDRLEAELNTRIEISAEWWIFESLRYRDLREQALSEAIAADLIIISASEDRELPEHVRDWIEEWLPEKHESASTLVALIDPSAARPASENPRRASEYLRHIARIGGLGYICDASQEHSAPAEGRKRLIWKRPSPRFTALGGALEPRQLVPRSPAAK
jgi:hypothetical protein